MGGEKRNPNKMLVGKPKEKMQLGRPICRWEDNKMDVGLDGVVWTGLTWLRTGTSGVLS
jgi:hypothetical protein